MICDDGDSGLQSLSYSLSDEAEFFDIDQNSGEIKLVDFADREWNAKQNGTLFSKLIDSNLKRVS